MVDVNVHDCLLETVLHSFCSMKVTLLRNCIYVENM